VMSYTDLVEARAKRAAKEQAAAGKGQLDRQCRSAVPEGGVLESTNTQVAPVARMI
jgi:hypothetical protein